MLVRVKHKVGTKLFPEDIGGYRGKMYIVIERECTVEIKADMFSFEFF